ncbi:MAG TPA: glycosyltransferase family 2 protein [Clostridia bacterium]|nr:glycosyltransferase family 2 protein [Clostridia bacterium]
MYDLSIAIVTYNNERVIEKCLTSIIHHLTGKLSYKIFVIDNSSYDQTVDIVKKVSSDIILLKNTDNKGFGTAHNQIMDSLDSRYHIVVNPDIVVDNNCILEMVEFMDKRSDIGLLSPLTKHPDGRIQYLCKRNPTFTDLFIRLFFPHSFIKRHSYFEMRNTGYDKEFEIEYATGCFMFFRTKVFNELRGFDEKFFLYLEDADITRRVNKISKSVFYPYNYVIHEWQRGSHKQLKLAWIDIQSSMYYFRKWGFRLF